MSPYVETVGKQVKRIEPDPIDPRAKRDLGNQVILAVKVITAVVFASCTVAMIASIHAT